MPGFLKVIFTRAAVLYLVCFFTIWRLLDYHQLAGNAVPQTLSRLTPPMDYFSEFVDRTGPYEEFKLMDCVNYHKAVAQFFPFQKAEAYGMEAFCYERLGRRSLAEALYRQSIASNPDYFWPYFDLGVLFYTRAQYPLSSEYFQKAVQLNPVKTVVLLTVSKVYNDVRLSKQTGKGYDFLQGIKEGRVEAHILLMDSLLKSGDHGLLLKTALVGINEGLDVNGVFYYYGGVAAYNLKYYEKAVELLQIALQKDPRNSDAVYYFGLCLKVAGKQDMAEAVLTKAEFLHKQGIDVLSPFLKARVRFF